MKVTLIWEWIGERNQNIWAPSPISHYFRPTEVDLLQADASKARERLGWEPKVGFDELITIMIDADLEAIGLQPVGRGQRILKARFSGWHQWSSSVTSVYQNANRHFE